TRQWCAGLFLDILPGHDLIQVVHRERIQVVRLQSTHPSQFVLGILVPFTVWSEICSVPVHLWRRWPSLGGFWPPMSPPTKSSGTPASCRRKPVPTRAVDTGILATSSPKRPTRSTHVTPSGWRRNLSANSLSSAMFCPLLCTRIWVSA